MTNDSQLNRYLLGLLPDEEADRLDELSIVDDEVAARLRAVENDLVDGYVRGTLDADVLKPFEAHYLASPRRRQKVTFARRFLGAVDRASARDDSAARTTQHAPVAAPPPAAAVESAPLRAGRSWLPLAAAALLLACGVLVLQEARLRRDLAVAQQVSAGMDERARTLAAQLEQQRAANDALGRDLDRARAPQALATIALVLAPPTRAAGPVPAIAVMPGATTVRVDLRLESNDFGRYDVALRDPASNRVIWRMPSLVAVTSRRGAAVSVSVPAALLKPQHYSLELSGHTAAGAGEVIGSYAFEIDPR